MRIESAWSMIRRESGTLTFGLNENLGFLALESALFRFHLNRAYQFTGGSPCCASKWLTSFSCSQYVALAKLKVGSVLEGGKSTISRL